MHDHEDDHIDGGIDHDLPRLLTRRRALGGVLGTASLAFLAACGSSTDSTATATTTTPAQSRPPGGQPPGGAPGGSSNVTVADGEIPEETAGPFPGDGTNGPDVLSQSGVVRSDITTSFGGSTGTAEGVPLTIRLLVQDEANACEPLAGAAVYLWHCDREGRYSLYSSGAEDQNYLRGVQAAGDDGIVTFTSIFPACTRLSSV